MIRKHDNKKKAFRIRKSLSRPEDLVHFEMQLPRIICLTFCVLVSQNIKSNFIYPIYITFWFQDLGKHRILYFLFSYYFHIKHQVSDHMNLVLHTSLLGNMILSSGNKYLQSVSRSSFIKSDSSWTSHVYDNRTEFANGLYSLICSCISNLTNFILMLELGRWEDLSCQRKSFQIFYLILKTYLYKDNHEQKGLLSGILACENIARSFSI